jgi:chorismate lyase/3-hydroxybenzoate synthase
VAAGAKKGQLQITLGPKISAPSADHRLLAAFQFGADTADSTHAAVIKPGLTPVDATSMFECWWVNGDVDYAQSGNLRLATCDDFALVVQQVPDAAPAEFEALTYSAYTELLQAIAKTPHRDIVKIWNYFGDINQGDDDAEKYRRFSIGRANAFDDNRVLEKSVPAGTAIGTPQSSQFTIISLSTSREFRPAENPRQVSAYEYPRQYGPRSPKFSRGGSVAASGSRLCVVSGTAAIIGHESQHPYDIEAQFDETVHNLDLLSGAIAALDDHDDAMSWRQGSVLRVYLKNGDDADFVRAQLKRLLGGRLTNVSLLHATICRRELVIEIDGACVLSAAD